LKRRVLIIGYYFVEANMGGVRLRRIARLLPRYGWEPVVLSHPPDPAGSAAVPEGVRLEQAAAPDLTRMYQKLRRLGRRESTSPIQGRSKPTAKPIGLTSKLNRWLMVPDKQVTWYRSALRRGRELLRREKFDAIFASLDPRTCLLVAARLSKETGVPCVLEYRDLWTGNPYYHVTQPTALHRWLHERLERKALRQARRVSAVCRGIADYLSQKHASVLTAPVELNYNFFDPEEYPPPAPVPAAPKPFTISYTGAMYANRSPHQFFQGLRVFLDRAGLTPGQCRFRWAGPISGIDDLDEIQERTGVRPYLDFDGQVPHREALRLLGESDAALLVQAPHDAIHIPGKLFEAMGARVPLLALAYPCEVTEIIERCRAGIVCPHTAPSVAEALDRFYHLWLQHKGWDFNEAEVRKFSAEACVRKLAELFEHCGAS
jgi:glycosyltransferase involved in cell wall biosynthesis